MPRGRKFNHCGRIVLCVSVLCFAIRLRADDTVADRVEIQVNPKMVVGRIPPDFLGFGYETSAVAQTNYFSAHNAILIRLYHNLGSQGLIRVGGNISDHTRYVPDGISAVRTERGVTIINHRNLSDLAGFARATGWRVMWGLNLGTGSKKAAAQEAVAVTHVLGIHLQSFQIGNEVDLHGRYELKYGDFDSYYSNYLAYKSAIRALLPSSVLSGPDVAGNMAWLRAFAKNEGKDIRLLTHHYYRTGAGTPDASIENLLQPDLGWEKRLRQLQAISRDSGVPFRINEVNSFYGGGKAGVSDTFASALWCLDYMYELAAYGCEGINLEADINQLGWISYYSPIVHDAAGNCHVRPEYYGMLAFALARGGDLLKLSLQKGDMNLSAYANKDELGRLWITVVNQDLSRDAELTVAVPVGYMRPEAFRLEAPSVTSTNRVSLAGTEVSVEGQWTPGLPENMPVKQGVVELLAPHASALLLRLQR